MRAPTVRAAVLAAAAGVVLALALPGAGLTPLILVFPGLMLESLEGAAGWRRGAWLGLVAGVAHWMTAANWVVPVMAHYGGLPLAAAVVCLGLMAALLGLCWAATAGLAVLVSPARRVWAFPALFLALDAWRQTWPYRFPWNPPAAALADWPALLGSLPLWGASGLGWAAVALGAGLWGLARHRTRRAGAVSIAVSIGLWLVASVLAPGPTPGAGTVRVAVIQPGTSLEQKWDPSQWREIEGRVWQLTAEAAARGAELVLWPESAMPYRIDSDPAYRAMLQEAAERLGVRLVLNAIGQVSGSGYANSAYAVGPEGVSPTRYDKVRLVPFGETVPWWARLAFARSLVREVGSFQAGSAPVVLDAGLPLGMAICYEVIFADLIATEVRAGAEVLATLTNDGWYGFSWAPRQHLAQVVLRAAESRRWFARAALTGISGFVDPSGRVVERLEVGEQGVLVVEVERHTGLTPRTRWGDWWAVLIALAATALLAIPSRPTE